MTAWSAQRPFEDKLQGAVHFPTKEPARSRRTAGFLLSARRRPRRSATPGKRHHHPADPQDRFDPGHAGLAFDGLT